ncbi:unnamed protein product [Lota lota]
MCDRVLHQRDRRLPFVNNVMSIRCHSARKAPRSESRWGRRGRRGQRGMRSVCRREECSIIIRKETDGGRH